LKFKDNTRLSEESLDIIDHLRNVGSYEGVYLFFGHDGNNVCKLTDFNGKVVINECSGKSMDEAVNRACSLDKKTGH